MKTKLPPFELATASRDINGRDQLKEKRMSGCYTSIMKQKFVYVILFR